jgi:hypothetical protein
MTERLLERAWRAALDGLSDAYAGGAAPSGPEALGVALRYVLVDETEAATWPRDEIRRRLAATDTPLASATRRSVASALDRALARVDGPLLAALASHPRAGLEALAAARAEAGPPAWDAWLLRLAQTAFERLTGEPVTPELTLGLVALEPRDVTRALPGGWNHAVVCGELLGFPNELYPLLLDAGWHEAGRAGGPLVNVLGVHQDWLTPAGEARRALFVDAGSGALVERSFGRPLPLHSTHFLYLGGERELERHAALARRLGPAYSFNHPSSARLCDRKSETFRALAAAGVPTPATVVVPASAPSETLAECLLAAGAAHWQHGFVVQPDDGSEGRGVAAFAALRDGTLDPTAVEHLRTLQATGDVVARERVVGQRYLAGTEGYSADLRVNVAWDGRRYRAESGYLQVATSAEADVASVGRGGRIVKLSEGALEGLGVPPAAYTDVLTLASDAAEALGRGSGGTPRLALVGLDLKLVVGEQGAVGAWVLDANPRPAGLSYCEYFDGHEPGVSAGLWQGLASAVETAQQQRSA